MPVESVTLTPAAVEDLFQSVLTAVTGEPVIMEGSPGPQPAERYCSFGFVSCEPLEHPVSEMLETESGEFAEFSRNETRCQLAVSFWGGSAISRAWNCLGHLQNSRRFFDLWRVLGFSGFDPVKAVGRAYLGKIQDSAQFTLYFYAALGAEYPADWFSHSSWGLELPEKPYHEDIVLPESHKEIA